MQQAMQFEKMGKKIVELREERARQKANAPVLPSKLAAIMTNHHMAKDQVAIEAQLRKAAYHRAHPIVHKEPTTEMERIIADDPKTSAQVIGSHRVPQLPPPPPSPPPLDELARMRTIFPMSTAAEVGFHHDFSKSNTKEAQKANQLIGGLTAAQLQADPKLANALSSLRTVVLDKAKRSGADGRPAGVKTKQR